VSAPAPWRSGYAAACKAVYTGSIPVGASYICVVPTSACPPYRKLVLTGVWNRLRGLLSSGADPRAAEMADVQRLYELTSEPGRVLPGREPVTVLHQDLGELALPDGRLMVSDPYFYFDGDVSLARRLSPGSYRAQLRVADLGGHDQRTAAALLVASDQEPASWEMAAPEGADPSELANDHSYGMGVDSGTGCFAAPDALRLLDAYLEEHRATTSLGTPDALADAMEEHYRSTWGWTNHHVAPGLNVIAFSTGFGDGFYPFYWGIDAAGEPACLLVDFGVLGRPGT
jgi:hypothetical protein